MSGIGKAIVNERSDDLVFTEAERDALYAILSEQPIRETVQYAALRLCRQLDLPENGSAYLCAAAEQIAPRLEAAAKHDNLTVLFL